MESQFTFKIFEHLFFNILKVKKSLCHRLNYNNYFTNIKKSGKIILAILLILQFNKTHANHVVGSDMFYECQGEGSTPDSKVYKLTHIQYADCNINDWGSQMFISLWHINEHTLVPFSLDSVVGIENPDYPCLELPTNVCVEKAIFSTEIELLQSDTSYIINMSYFNMSIWNRWGENIFNTSNPNEGWNGRFQNIGKNLQSGVYTVRVSYGDTRKKNHSIISTVSLIR